MFTKRFFHTSLLALALVAQNGWATMAQECERRLTRFEQQIETKQEIPLAVANLRTDLASMLVESQVPAFLKKSRNGAELPVVLVNKDTYGELKSFLSHSMGTQIQLQPDYKNDHGMLRVSQDIIDVDTPGARAFGELNKNGIAWKNLASYLPRRKDTHSVILEVAYALTSEEQRTAEYYQRMRRASIVRVPFTFGGAAVDRDRPNTVTAGEHCFVFCKGSVVSSHVSEIERKMNEMGVKDVKAFMARADVQKYLATVRAELLAADANDPGALSPVAFSKPAHLMMLQDALPAALENYDRKILANWIVGLDASTKYQALLRTLGVSSDMSVADMDNPRATAILVYDKPGAAQDFRDATYETAGVFYNWTQQGQRKIEALPAPKTYSPAYTLRKHGVVPSTLSFRVTDGEAGFTISVSHNGKSAGFIDIEQSIGDDGKIEYVIANVEVGESLRGKGLGTLLYLAAARYLDEKLGHVLHQSALVSEDARKLWSTLVKHGLAEEFETENGKQLRMSAAGVKGAAAQNALDFVLDRPQAKGGVAGKLLNWLGF